MVESLWLLDAFRNWFLKQTPMYAHQKFIYGLYLLLRSSSKEFRTAYIFIYIFIYKCVSVPQFRFLPWATHWGLPFFGHYTHKNIQTFWTRNPKCRIKLFVHSTQTWAKALPNKAVLQISLQTISGKNKIQWGENLRDATPQWRCCFLTLPEVVSRWFVACGQRDHRIIDC